MRFLNVGKCQNVQNYKHNKKSDEEEEQGGQTRGTIKGEANKNSKKRKNK